MKTCKTCQQDKVLGEFYKNKLAKDKKASSCKVCSKRYSAQYRLKNPEQVKKRVSKWKSTHKKEINQCKADWAKKNPDKIKSNRDNFNQANPEKKAIYNRRTYEKHKDIIKERVKLWRIKYPEKRRQQSLKYTAIKKGATVGNVDIPTLIATWDRLCGICTEPVADQYHVDHIMPLSKGGKHCQDNLQLTHPTCNIRKGNKVLV